MRETHKSAPIIPILEEVQYKQTKQNTNHLLILVLFSKGNKTKPTLLSGISLSKENYAKTTLLPLATNEYRKIRKLLQEKNKPLMHDKRSSVTTQQQQKLIFEIKKRRSISNKAIPPAAYTTS